MKKVLSLLLISIMMLSLAACTGDKEPVREVGGQIIVGNTTELTGDWITTFQNNAADNDVLNFISGYSVVDITIEGEYVIDETVVKEYDVTENTDGSKTYTFTINKGLKWNDGVEVKAEQYVGGILLWNSYFIRQLGGSNTGAFRLVGHSPYASGDTNVFEGVRLLGDYQFSLTINPTYVPYFYELAMVGYGPTRLDYWLGDVNVKDDGNGAYFDQEITLEDFEDHFRDARNNPIYPASGPYMVESYDEASKTAVLKVNPNYAGDRTGQKPAIETVIYKRVIQDTMIDELATGSVDALVGILQGDYIDAGFDLVDQGGYNYLSYPRAGYGKLTFVCDFGPTQFKEVRQALAHLLDRNDFARTFTGGYGNVINGPFGEGQWFYQETKNTLDSKINHYSYDADRAVELLEDGGWVYTATGAPWTPASGPRHKQLEDGTYMPLVIQWASSEQNAMSDLLVISLAENPDLIDAGIVIEQTQMTFTELLSWHYRDGSQDPRYEVPTYNMFNLATNFTPMYDLTKWYSQDPADIANGSNTNFILDDKLESMIAELVLRGPEDRDGFKNDWVDFIVYWNELLPDLPLYSNILHDFYSDKIQGWNNSPFWRMHHNVLYSWVE